MTTINFRTFHHPKRSPIPIGSHSPFFSNPNSSFTGRQPLNCFLSLQIYLLWTLHIMESCNMWSFVTGFYPLACLTTCCIHAVACISVLHFFSLPSVTLNERTTFYSSIYQLMTIWQEILLRCKKCTRVKHTFTHTKTSMLPKYGCADHHMFNSTGFYF